MIRTRCPACESVFRVTPEQLELKAGTVRCGHCRSVFNALENRLGEAPGEALRASPPVDLASSREPLVPPVAPGEAATHASDVPSGTVAEPILSAPFNTSFGSKAPIESARDAGLVAVREFSETRVFNRWAAGTMATDGSLGLQSSSRPRRTAWLAVLAVLLVFLFAGQVIHHFRSDVVVLEPRLAPLLSALHIDVPRPAHGDLVVIESSDLQANGEGVGLLLSATLKNRAAYIQAWPMLEVTLTDANDKIVVRRVFAPAEYLSAERIAAGFLPHAEVAIKLLLDADDVVATGYGLYAFYP